MDLTRRLEQHARNHTYTTARDAPWELVASAKVTSLPEARDLERMFKRWKNPARVSAWFSRAPAESVSRK